MVKTRKGAKRASVQQLEEESPDIDKKQKLECKTESKYFQNNSSSGLNKERHVDLQADILINSNDSNDAIIVNKAKKTLKIEEESDSDGSSSDEFMKAPLSLDDLGSFETLQKGKTIVNESKNPTVCSRLSDDSDGGKEIIEQEFYDFSQIIKSQELINTTKKELEQKHKQEDETLSSKRSRCKTNKPAKKIKSENKPNLKSIGEELGISELLAIAEGPSAFGLDDKVDSDSDNNNEEIKTEDIYTVPKEGVQVTVEFPNMTQMKKKKGSDIEAALKRRINLIRKENQVFMHKVHTLCWIAHGINLNHTINNENLMGLALSLIPSDYCYPKKHLDLRYVEKLVEWFAKKIVVDNNHKLALNSTELPLIKVLEMEINSKVVSSVKDLVLIFVCLLRSLGINARLVINLRPVPLRPPASDLCSLSNKPVPEKSPKINKSTTPSKIASKCNGSMDKSSIKKSKNHLNREKDKPLGRKDPDVKSPYFSSSDDLPLTELVSRKCTPKKSKNSSMSKADYIMSEKETITKSELRKPRSEIKKNSKSQYFKPVDYEKPTVEKKQRSVRKSAPTSLQDDSSSEDELFEKRAGKQKRSNVIIQKQNPKTTKNSRDRKSKVEAMDGEFEAPRPSTSKPKSVDRRVLSTDDDDDNTTMKIGNDFWSEVFVEAEEKWISVDLPNGKIHQIQLLHRRATQPVRYILAWNNDNTIKDVTRRYAPDWLTTVRRQRADDSWWHETMAPYTPTRNAREREEDEDLDRQIHDQPLPASISDFKNHPLFALRRHLLKFEAIYPPDAPPLGYIKNEPIYSRGCVVQLHTRETWIKEAKLVRRDEEPYKIVKARPKYDKLSGARLNDLPLPLFGYWQVDDYIPPPAVDGKVPRNEYGNVELYKPCMLPPGTVHLQVPGLGRVARKLEIDCAPAVVGWEFSGGGSHPVLDGFIVCEEFKDILLDAWNKDVDESAKRAKKKVEQRVYGNWKRLIKGLLIKERLKARYDFGEVENTSGKKKKKHQPKAGTSKS